MYIDITEIPAAVATLLGTSAANGGIIATIALLTLTVLPLVLVARGMSNGYVLGVIVGVMDLAFATIVTWIDAWYLLFFIIIIAALFGLKLRGVGG